MITVSVSTPGLYSIALSDDCSRYEATEVITRDTAHAELIAAVKLGHRAKAQRLLLVYGARNLKTLRDADVPQFVKILRVIVA